MASEYTDEAIEELKQLNAHAKGLRDRFRKLSPDDKIAFEKEHVLVVEKSKGSNKGSWKGLCFVGFLWAACKVRLWLQARGPVE